MALPWFIFAFTFPIYSTIILKLKLENEISIYLVFLNLAVLFMLATIGDLVILFTETENHEYQIQNKYTIPYLGVEREGDDRLRSFAAPQSSETVTMISCWPYATNSHRIVIIAIPSWQGNQNDSQHSN